MNAGFKNTFVCDLAKEPLSNLKSRCLIFPDNQLLHSNFFDLNIEPFDLIIEQTFFCALNPMLRQNYFNKMQSLLKLNGQLVGLLFNTVFDSEKNGPPYGGNLNEYLNYIKNTTLKVIKMDESRRQIHPSFLFQSQSYYPAWPFRNSLNCR
mgnify:CR=1 FL=1